MGMEDILVFIFDCNGNCELFIGLFLIIVEVWKWNGVVYNVILFLIFKIFIVIS